MLFFYGLENTTPFQNVLHSFKKSFANSRKKNAPMSKNAIGKLTYKTDGYTYICTDREMDVQGSLAVDILSTLGD